MEVVFAYIDPGSGSLIIQAVIAGLVALPIFFRHHIRRFINIIRRNDADGSADPPPTDDSARGN